MKAVIIGGGKGCRSLISLTTGTSLKEFKIDVLAVVDINPNAPGVIFAREHGLATFSTLTEALDKLEIELIIELTGSDNLLQNLYKDLKPGIKIIDHSIARIFWDILNVQEEQKFQFFELERLEKNIEKEKYFLQSIFDSYSDLAVVLDKDMKIIRANTKFIKFVKFNEDQIIGKTCNEALANTELSDNTEESYQLFEEVLQSGLPQNFIRLTPPPDESHWEIIRTPILTENGETEAVLGTWHKITDIVILKRKAESAENILNSFINSAQDWISIKDLAGRYVIANPVTAEAFDLKPEDFIGKKPEEILPLKHAYTVKMHDKEVLESKQYHYYDEIIPVHGQDHVFQTIRFPLADYKGDLIGVCTIARDVTKEYRLQEQLAQSEKLAALGKLAAGVAHEINNPLTGILAYTEDIIEELPKDDPHIDDLKVILRETLRCRDIVRNLLDFARQDKPKLEINEANDIVESALNLIIKLPQFKDIIIIKNITENIPFIHSDSYQIQQVLLNLLLNAADAMKYKGKITIYTEYDFKNNNCIISIEDTGPGIPENLIDKIFEPFFSTKGTNGIGLAVSWGIVERHHGTIEIDIAESGGAIFRIVLPAYKIKE